MGASEAGAGWVRARRVPHIGVIQWTHAAHTRLPSAELEPRRALHGGAQHLSPTQWVVSRGAGTVELLPHTLEVAEEEQRQLTVVLSQVSEHVAVRDQVLRRTRCGARRVS